MLTALEWHPTAPAVLVKGLWALKNIAHVEAGADALIAAGGHALLVTYAIKYATQQPILEQGLGGLLNLMHHGGYVRDLDLSLT